MTGWRVDVAIKAEDKNNFGKEKSGSWHYLGVGKDFNFNFTNGWSFKNGIGSKIPELEFEGRLNGTWGGSLYLDYNNFYWLLFGLEGYGFFGEKEGNTVKRGVHVFSTNNSKALRPFSLLIRKLDREVGGKSDEEIVLLGCTMTKVSPSYESNTAGVRVSIGGSTVNTKLTYRNLENSIGYNSDTKKNIRPVEWGCLQVMNEKDTAWEKIANNEKSGFTFSRTVTTVPECGERVDTAFYESNVQPISITSTVFSRNPNQWQTRMHSGGIRNDVAVDGTSEPWKKGLEAMPNIRIASSTVHGTTDTEGSSVGDDYVSIAEFEEVVVDSWGNTYNSGSEITENPTLKARKGRIILKTPDVTETLGQSDQTLTICQVVFNFNDSNVTKNLVEYYALGDVIPMPKPQLEGKTFVSWQNSGTSYTDDKVTLAEDMATDNVIAFTAQYSE